MPTDENDRHVKQGGAQFLQRSDNDPSLSPYAAPQGEKDFVPWQGARTHLLRQGVSSPAPARIPPKHFQGNHHAAVWLGGLVSRRLYSRLLLARRPLLKYLLPDISPNTTWF
jgi:hypothetical protein